MRPGQKVRKTPGPDFGVRVIQPTAALAGGGWWDDFGLIPCCVAAYQPKGAASLAASYIDLSGSGNNAAPGVAPAWAAGIGWTFNGVNQFLTTGVVPGATYSLIVQHANSTIDWRPVCGSMTNATTRFYVIPRSNANATTSYRWGATSVNIAPATATGNLAETPTTGYRNGVPHAALGGWVGLSVDDAYIGCFNNAGAAASFYGGDVIALALYSCNIDAWAAALAAWMAAI